MTRTFNEKIRCKNCGHEDTAETDFERWMRQNKDLDSSKGLVRYDLDILLHRYKFVKDGKGCRDIQCMMFVEVKTFMAKPSDAQRDTLGILDKVLRNRKGNIYGKPRKQADAPANSVWSRLLKRDVTIRLFGGHLLQIDGTHPDNSKLMLWDYIEVNPKQLTELLMFERNPDKPHLMMDHRRRSKPWAKIPMFDFMNSN